ncbi:DAZ interacting zinc finger protein 1 [Anticarsia gemmatalis]|uniref:DAZ interacting zinc finger protein 1 n=1 Tax=Anticarsia gemmatalis TaxID=129554 RepID=UPI003F777370
MACKASFELHHHFPKLAEESGFTFNTHRPRIHIDWNKIRLIDIDSLIKERKFVIIEQHLNDILDCVFESEFDVRILDEGVMKMFRLAQLAVEYQQFCRHYLDRSVYVLREEITSLAQELDTCKKDLREKDDEIRKLKKRSRHSFKTPLPYGNDNIATMILKTLSHKGDIFPSPSNDSLQYNKCNYCEKVFLNQLYLKSHISRRHANIIEAPQKDKQDNNVNNENTKLSAEVTELKNKIKEMEIIIANTNSQITANRINAAETKTTVATPSQSTTEDRNNKNNVTIQEVKKVMKDAEVSTNNEEYLLNKLEEWKKAEHENYNKEMNKLRNQIMETINTIKEKENSKNSPTQSDLIVQLHDTIKQQGAEILALKKELNDSRIRTEKENAERSKEAEAQVSFWSNRAETQSKQYELLLQKLNDVAKDAKESRALAEAERERAAQLKILLQQSLSSKTNESVESTDDLPTPEKKVDRSTVRKKSTKVPASTEKAELEADRNSLEKLHRKAQELLNIASITSSSSDTSSSENVQPMHTIEVHTDHRQAHSDKNHKISNIQIATKSKKIEEKPQKMPNSTPIKTNKLVNGKGPKMKKEKLKPNHIKTSKGKNGPNIIPGSPMKLVRAKITEEVNSRLVSAGVDPLKSRLPQTVFQKQRMQLHHNQELKAKKNPAHSKVRHSILALLDSSTPEFRKEVIQVPDYTSPTKAKKPFKNLTSVISNVKTKALSLVKMNDSNVKEKQKSQHTEVAKRAMSLLKTPPGSGSTSPVSSKRSPLKAFDVTQNFRNTSNEPNNGKETKSSQDSKSTPKKIKKSLIATKTHQIPEALTSNTEDDSEESDHKYYNTTTVQQSKSIETLIKSPARRPASASADYNHTVQKFTISDDNILRTQSVTNLVETATNLNNIMKNKPQQQSPPKNDDDSSDDVESLSNIPIKKSFLEDNTQNTTKQTKSVLKNASSTSSLNKKKVLFDMDAIQMKSVSASPSQSLTEKSEGNEKYELGLVNLDGEEWDISSIENEPLKNDTKIQNVTRTSPKIAELKEKIESQLARRNDTPTTALVGGVDVLAGTMVKASSIGGSNTSLGSSILDDSESVPIVNHKTIVKPKKVTVKDDSDIDISEFSIDGIVNKNESF